MSVFAREPPHRCEWEAKELDLRKVVHEFIDGIETEAVENWGNWKTIFNFMRRYREKFRGTLSRIGRPNTLLAIEVAYEVAQDMPCDDLTLNPGLIECRKCRILQTLRPYIADETNKI